MPNQPDLNPEAPRTPDLPKVEPAELLEVFGIVTENGCTRLPEQADPTAAWIMRSISVERQDRLVFATLGDLPACNLVAPFDAWPRLWTETGTHDFYVGIEASPEGPRPVVMKLFRPDELGEIADGEILVATTYDRLAIGPGVRGAIVSQSGARIGYAMDVLIGKEARFSEEPMDDRRREDLREIYARAGAVGISAPRCFLTSEGRLVAMDAGDAAWIDQCALRAFADMVRASSGGETLR
jgi:nucleotide-binding universal stress UspA family protein